MLIKDFKPSLYISKAELVDLRKNYFYQLFLLEGGFEPKIYIVKYKELDSFSSFLIFLNIGSIRNEKEIKICPEICVGEEGYENYWQLKYIS